MANKTTITSSKKNFHSKLVTQDLDDDGVYHIETKQDAEEITLFAINISSLNKDVFALKYGKCTLIKLLYLKRS